MVTLANALVEFYQHVFIDIADERTNNFFLIRSPLPVLMILVCYVHFVTNLGPRWMKRRQPFNLKSIMIVYNIIQILINSFLFVEAFRHGWGGQYNWICQPIDWSDTPFNKYVVSLCYLYFVIKMVDLLDTIFMVLRKKDDHISFLHVYHHTGMCALAWGGVKYLPGGHGTFLGFINTFVHAVMYGYYLFATIYPENSGKNWWKKYLTQLQMAQFLMVAVHMLLLLFQPNCSYPKFTVFILTPQNIFMFILFCDFYRKTYLKPKTPKLDKNGVSKSNGTSSNGVTKNGEKIHAN
ncbi:very long chain fatty acid elongase 7-like [Planococcus citri]|uniref:very long chain fatty acid elongase 7-like n=1 Tax=Planococcus citri TaxID=170843 RepID=UPI0031F8D7B4